MRLSLCMIVKDEEEVLEGLLKTVKPIMDEIVIVDTGSSDNTKEIAARFTDNIYDFEWINDFSAARNYSFSLANGSHIMWLDADDMILEEDVKKLLQLKEELSDAVDAVSMYYHTAFDEKGNPSFKYRRNRIVKRENNFKWTGAVHEYLEAGGQIRETDIAITHRKQVKQRTASDRNLQIYQGMMDKGVQLSPRDLFYYANELKDHGQAERAAGFYERFLASGLGWVEDNIRACEYLAACYKQLAEEEKYLQSLYRSFRYDRPRPEFCCTLGDKLVEDHNYSAAIFWYKGALDYEGKELPGFSIPAYTSWYPYIQLTLCYDRIGDTDAAIAAHAQAKRYAPEHPSVQYNETYFTSIS